jgi:4-hydroxyacetophenone monooxygenase
MAEPRIHEDLRVALREADVTMLLMVLVQLTGDHRWLHEPYRPVRGTTVIPDPSGGLDEDRQAEIREAAFAVLSTALLEPNGHPSQPSEALVTEMMSVCVGGPVPAEYAPMMLEEMGFKSRDVGWRRRPRDEILSDFHVLVIGAGISGICVAIKLERLGIRYTVIEKNEAVGGTWFENTYPGCAVDVPNHFYSYSFEPNHDWPDFFSKRNELHHYLERCATKYGIRPRVQLSSEVLSAKYLADTQRWCTKVRRADGRVDELVSNVVISAVGQLNRPKIPSIDGVEAFVGPLFHSSRWRHDVELDGKRVAVVGTGASAMQLVPSTAAKAKQLVIFQRSPQWAIPNSDYHRAVPEGKKWLLNNVPFYASWYRFSLLWRLGDGLWPSLHVDPEWPDRDRSINSVNDRVRRILTRHMVSELGNRQDLLPKVLPTYPPYSKRIIIDNGWFSTLTADNVELVTDPIAQVTPTGIETSTGNRYPLDVIIFATGFKAAQVLWPIEVIGRTGRSLEETWRGDDPRAYLGITMPDFPNFFCLYGPSTNLGHGGSIIFHSECQTRYIMCCLRELLEGEYAAMECRPDVHDEYNQRLDAALQDMIWSQVDVDSWYKNSQNRVVANSPWRLVDYWNMTRHPDLSDFILEPLHSAAASGSR